MTTETDTFCALEDSVSELASMGNLLSCLPPGTDLSTDEAVNVLGRQISRLESAWSAFVEARHAAKSAE